MTRVHGAFVAAVAATFAGQLAALAFEIVLADRFGTGLHADALALTLPLVLVVANEVSGWVSALFVPYFLEAETRAGASAARRFFRAYLVLGAAATGVAAMLLIVAAPMVIRVLAASLADRSPAVSLLRWAAPLLVLLPLSTVLAGVLQAHGRFVLASTRQLFWYGGALLLLIAAGTRLGVEAVPIGMVAGLAIFIAMLAFRRDGGPAEGDAEPAGPRLRRLLAALPPLAGASASNWANVTIERWLAARLPAGRLAALTYAFRLLNVPVNLFLMNATMMLFTPLAAHAARGDRAALERLLHRALRLAFILTAPLAGLAVALALPIVRVLFERGRFTPESTALTATALALYAPAIVGMAGVQVLVRAYQASGYIRLLAATGSAIVAVTIALMLGLTALLGFAGLPLATSVNWLLLLATMLVALRRRLPGLRVGVIARSAGRTALAATGGGVAAWLTGGTDGRTLIDVLTAGVVGLGVYAAILVLLSREDARLAMEFLVPGLAPSAAEQA